MVLDFLVENPWLQNFSKEVQNWTVIVSAFALGLGAVSLFRIHGKKVAKKDKGWINSIVLIAAMLFMTFQGIAGGSGDKSYLFVFDNMLNP